MTTDEIIKYCLEKDGAYVDFPFGEIPVCIKVSGRLFAQVYPRPEDLKITLNCDRFAGELYRSSYPGVVVRGYHCPPVQQPYFNTIFLNGKVPDDILKIMMDLSYSTVVRKLPLKIRQGLVGV